MPDRTHNITVAILPIFYENSFVLQHFIATGVPSFIPDDIIIAVESHSLMPEITHIATVIYVLAGSRCVVFAAIFTDSFWCIGVILTDNPHILA